MRYCFQLAKRGFTSAGKNPIVGSVLVHQDRVIGKGYYRKYGGPHAEVDCIRSVKVEDKYKIPDATLFVSLEPCCIHAKTPPCTDLIIASQIKHVVISALDINPSVHMKGVKVLREHGILVETGILENEGRELLTRFRANHIYNRPYVLLKWAHSVDYYIGKKDQQIWLSNQYSGIYTHSLRASIDGILIGSTTAKTDNPSLTTRHYPGNSPMKILIDRGHQVPISSNIFLGGKVLYFTSSYRELPENIIQELLDPDLPIPKQVLDKSFEYGVNSILVEGGSHLLNHWISTDLWDEAIIIATPTRLYSGITAPLLHGRLNFKFQLDDDTFHLIRK